MNFTDDTPVNAKELAATLRVSRSTVFNWKKQGYRFEFGIRTTPGTEARRLYPRKSRGIQGFRPKFLQTFEAGRPPDLLPAQLDAGLIS